MLTIIKFLILILLANHIVRIEAAPSTSNYRYPVPTCNQMIKALDDIVKYYERNYKLMIFDAYYGLVRSEGMISCSTRTYIVSLKLIYGRVYVVKYVNE